MDVIFQSHPDVIIATNTFRNVGTIIQYEGIPLFEVGKFETAGYTTRFSVFHSDGTKIAVVKGSQIYLTEEGKKARIEMRHEPNLTACEVEGKTIFELRREGAAALKGSAELFTPDGAFVRANDDGISGVTRDDDQLKVGNMTMKGCLFANMRIAILVSNGRISIGVT